MPAAARPLQPAGERFLSLREQLDSPSVLVDFVGGAAANARLEILDAPHGPPPAAVVRSLARNLGVFPGSLDAETDPVFPGEPAPQGFHVLVGGCRVALVLGMELDDFIDAVIAVGVAAMRPRRADR